MHLKLIGSIDAGVRWCGILYGAIVMIFDVARHKFSEGLLTLLFFALMAMVVALSMGGGETVEGGAPLMGFVERVALNHPILSALALLPMVVYAGLRFSRAAVRVGIYSASSLAPVALGGVAMFACLTTPNYLSMMVVILLVSEVFGRLFYSLGANIRIGFLFTSMLSLGVMPLVDSALIPLTIALSLIVIFVRGTLRETIVTLVGVASPTFVYCYLVWLFGGEFDVAFMEIWGWDNLLAQHGLVVTYLTLPRLVFLGLTLFANLCSILVYHNVRVTLVDSTRAIWRLLIVLEILLVAMLLLLPSASPAVVASLVLVMTLMLPQLFIRLGVYVATIAYLIWVVSALATIL